MIYSSFRYLAHKACLRGTVGCASDWRSGVWEFDPHRVWQHSFKAIDHEIFFMVILSLPLIQEGHLSVSGERIRKRTGEPLRRLILPQLKIGDYSGPTSLTAKKKNGSVYFSSSFHLQIKISRSYLQLFLTVC